MSKFLTITLPAGLEKAQKVRKEAESRKFEIVRKLDYDDMFGDHVCDCEYCESKDYAGAKMLSESERFDIEAELEVLNKDLTRLDLSIKRMISYRKFMENKTDAR